MFFCLISETIKDVTHQLGTHIEHKHYLHATELLSSSVAQLEGDLLEVDAMRDVRMELTAKKEVHANVFSLHRN